jgi:outer membrane receptor for ferrienterochelin and colicins
MRRHYAFNYALCISAVLLTFTSNMSAQSSGSITGIITDDKSGEGLIGASIRLILQKQGTVTDVSGKYNLLNLEPGDYKLQFSYVGYKPVVRIITVTKGTVVLNVKMQSLENFVNELVVTASKGKLEKKLDAPITIETVGFEAIKQTASSSPLGAVAKLKGVDFVERGINTVDITSRGLNTQFNTRMLTLIDGRLATLPGLGLPQFTLSPTPTLDIASIEVAVGPAAALYGPNAHAGVVNMITKDPFNFPGIDMSVRGGTQSLIDVGLRYADYKGNFGWKVTGQYMQAQQFESGNTFIYSRVTPQRIGENQTLLNPETPPLNQITPQIYQGFLNDGRAFTERQLSEMRAGLQKVDGAFYYQSEPFNAKFAAGYSESRGLIGSNFGVLEAKGYVIQYQNIQFSGLLGKLAYFLQGTRTANAAGQSFQQHDKAQFLSEQFSAAARRLGFDSDNPQGLSRADYNRILSNVNYAIVDSLSSTTDNSQLWDSEAQLRYEVSGLEFVGGFQYRYYNPSANFLAGFDNPLAVSLNGARDITATELGSYLQVDKRLFDNKLRLSAAARLDDHTYYDPQFSPKLAAVVSFNSNHNLRASVNRAFKVPVILENHLFFQSGLGRGNFDGYTVVFGGQVDGQPAPTLQAAINNGGRVDPPNGYSRLVPEQVTSIELGYKGIFSEKLLFDAVGYYSLYKNFISPAFQIASGTGQFAYDGNGNLLRNTINPPQLGRVVTSIMGLPMLPVGILG